MLISRLLNSGSSGNSNRLVRCVAVLIAVGWSVVVVAVTAVGCSVAIAIGWSVVVAVGWSAVVAVLIAVSGSVVVVATDWLVAVAIEEAAVVAVIITVSWPVVVHSRHKCHSPLSQHCVMAGEFSYFFILNRAK